MTEVTYNDILKRLLERVPEGIDKREGSIVYDALAPAAMELRLLYLAIEEALDDTFADTASREFLVRRAAERGISPKPAACAVLRALAQPEGVEIPVGARFEMGGRYYAVIGGSGGGYRVKCETEGRAGNEFSGSMIPVDHIRGLERFYAVELLIPGEDEEDTESLRERYIASFGSHSFGGNIDDYVEKTRAVPGVGAVRVTPAWDGGGTVKLTILDSEFNAAGEELIESVHALFDPNGGDGLGLAPIGHVVTVCAPGEVAVDVSCELVLEQGADINAVREAAREKLGEYLLELRREWADKSSVVVRLTAVEARLMSVEGVVDVLGTKLCGVSGNLELVGGEVPVGGEFDCG